MIKKLKSSTDATVVKIARVLPRFNPNFITILGVVPPILFFWLVTHNYFGWALLALAGTSLDSIDGAYARATGQATKFGAVLDASLDRFADALIISVFGFAGLITWPMAIALIIASFLISYIKAAAAANGIDPRLIAAGPIERQHRLIIIFIGLALYAFVGPTMWGWRIIPVAFLILTILSLVTVARRLLAARRA